MKKDDFEYVLSLLKKYAGWELGEDKYFILDRKIYNFVREKNYSSVEDLIAELRLGQKTLLWQVIEALTLSDTCFYRDYKVFCGFENRILPYLRESNRGSRKIRIWSLGCSSGQETYSIAMSVKSRLFAASDWDVKIIGTDISTASVSKAQKGLYTQFEVQMGLNARMIINNFHQEKDGYSKYLGTHLKELALDFLNDLLKERKQRYFGDWCDYHGYGDAGYYLGAYFMRYIIKKTDLDRAMDLDIKELKELYLDFIDSL